MPDATALEQRDAEEPRFPVKLLWKKSDRCRRVLSGRQRTRRIVTISDTKVPRRVCSAKDPSSGVDAFHGKRNSRSVRRGLEVGVS